MHTTIDARKKVCPLPVIMAKAEVDNGSQSFSILVDNRTAVENLTRFADAQGFSIQTSEEGADFSLVFTKNSSLDSPTSSEHKSSWGVFVGKERLGQGSDELGESLMKMFFFSLTKSEHPPAFLFFMNSGVKLTVEDPQIIGHLEELQGTGTQILICGTCLNYYSLADACEVGTVSNMYDIVESLSSLSNVITL